MPNHVDNVLSAIGSPEEVAAFVLAARGRMPKSGDWRRGVQLEPQDDEPKETSFCFHALVPLPEEYSSVPYGDGSHRSGYRMEVEAWGIKWGAYSISGPVMEGVRHAHATWSFQTAWSHCGQMLQKASKRFPGLVFHVAFGGEVDVPVRFVVADGRMPAATIPDTDSPKREEDEDENSHWRAYSAWRDSLLAAHPATVAHALASCAGLEGMEPGPLLDWLSDNGCERLAAWIGESGWTKALATLPLFGGLP